MSSTIQISPAGMDSIRRLEVHLEGISQEQLTETALSITAALYEKSAGGARILVEYPEGRTEELRFRVKRPKKKA